MKSARSVRPRPREHRVARQPQRRQQRDRTQQHPVPQQRARELEIEAEPPGRGRVRDLLQWERQAAPRLGRAAPQRQWLRRILLVAGAQGIADDGPVEDRHQRDRTEPRHEQRERRPSPRLAIHDQRDEPERSEHVDELIRPDRARDRDAAGGRRQVGPSTRPRPERKQERGERDPGVGQTHVVPRPQQPIRQREDGQRQQRAEPRTPPQRQRAQRRQRAHPHRHGQQGEPAPEPAQLHASPVQVVGERRVGRPRLLALRVPEPHVQQVLGVLERELDDRAPALCHPRGGEAVHRLVGVPEHLGLRIALERPQHPECAEQRERQPADERDHFGPREHRAEPDPSEHRPALADGARRASGHEPLFRPIARVVSGMGRRTALRAPRAEASVTALCRVRAGCSLRMIGSRPRADRD